MPESLLLDWARRSGFTLGELAMIQPAYGGIPDPDGPMLSTAVESGVLAVASLLAGANTALIASERGPRWTGAAGAVLGGSVLALALNNDELQGDRYGGWWGRPRARASAGAAAPRPYIRARTYGERHAGQG